VSRTDLPSSVLWCNRQIEARLILRYKSINRRGDFEPQIEKPSTLLLRLNQETCTPNRLMHSTNRTRCHLTSRSSGHRVPDLCLTISGSLHQISYSWLEPRHCPSCRTYHLHTMRQANVILHTNQMINVKLSKCLESKFKHRHVNDSSHIKPRY
jgi:hypothetical protein